MSLAPTERSSSIGRAAQDSRVGCAGSRTRRRIHPGGPRGACCSVAPRSHRCSVRAVKVVLLHALPLDASMWDPVRDGLEAEVVAPTLYGLGASVASWAAAVLDLAGPDPVVAVGNSVGGSCAIEMAHLAPERVRALVLIGAKAGHRPEPDLRDAAIELLEAEGMVAAWPAFWKPLFAPAADRAVVDHARRIALAVPSDEVIGGVRAFHARADRTEVLGSYPGPVMVVRGEHDRIPRHPAEVAAGLRQGTFHQVDGIGHYVPLEHPEATRRLITDALEVVASR